MIEHVNRSVDKGIVTSVVAVYKAKLAIVSEDDVGDMLQKAFDDREDYLQRMRESGRDVFVCTVQYQVGGVGHSMAVSAEIVEGANGSRTLGPVEFFAGDNDSGEGTPLAAELVFDTSRFLPWTEKN